ncbi:hypothetical protein [Xanthocytophaga flava]|uniref:hypothetical protein n=1 Tax=Xanthocytophaga flava TaxID=3048013 RepID=UPI0028D1BB5F|nr:hypothetical protein [Xanthocytophaga flavus]MDJ1468164.1 hypothetical protein [Xanthocytophaga flavus]
MSKGTPDKLDIYRSYLIDEQPLNDTQQRMLEQYRRAFALLSAGYFLQQAVKILISETRLSMPQCYQIVRESLQLFGNIIDSDKEGLRAVQIERLKQLSRKAEKAGDFKAAARLEDQASKLMKLFEDKMDLLNPADFKKPTTVIFTNDPKILERQQKENTSIQDTDFEEITDLE